MNALVPSTGQQLTRFQHLNRKDLDVSETRKHHLGDGNFFTPVAHFYLKQPKQHMFSLNIDTCYAVMISVNDLF